jgi:ketosteroid isomerase-like protein
MTEDDVRRGFAALSSGDVDPFVALLAEDCVLEFPGSVFGGTYQGTRRIRVFLRQNQRLFRDGLVFSVHWVHVGTQRAVAQWTNAGTTRQGMPYANRGVTVLHLGPEGRVTRLQDYLDTETIARTWPRP